MEKYATALLNSKEVVTSNMVINGVPQGGVKQNVYFISCTNCNRVLAQFNPGDPLVGVIQCVQTQLAPDIKYCPSCGAKLNYTADIIEYTETETNNESN